MSQGRTEPRPDRTDDLKAHPDGSVELDEAAGTVTLFARREMDTVDLEDFLIPLDTEFKIGFAYNNYYNYLSPYTPH